MRPPITSVHFGDFRLDGEARELYRGGSRIRLQEKPLLVLCLLIERRGKLVSRDELRNALWSSDTHVDFDRNLNTAVKKLRIALCDSADAPRYVETIPKRGYRFIAEVQRAAPEMPEPAPAVTQSAFQPEVGAGGPSSPLARQQLFARAFAAARAVLAAALIGLMATSAGDALPAPFKSRTCPEAVAVAVLPFQHEGRGAPHELSAELNAEVPRRLVNATGGGVSVLAGRTVNEYACSKKDYRRMRAELGARYVVEGAVRKTDSGLRVTAQLFETTNGTLVAAESVDVPAGGANSAHDHVAEMVASAVLRCVAPAQRVSL